MLEGIGEIVPEEKETDGRAVSDHENMDRDRSPLPSMEGVDGKDEKTERDSLSDKTSDRPARSKKMEMDPAL